MPKPLSPVQALVDLAWRDRNHRTTRRTAHQRGVTTCAQCGVDLPNHCYWAEHGDERRWACSLECLDATQVKSGLA